MNEELTLKDLEDAFFLLGRRCAYLEGNLAKKQVDSTSLHYVREEHQALKTVLALLREEILAERLGEEER